PRVAADPPRHPDHRVRLRRVHGATPHRGSRSTFPPGRSRPMRTRALTFLALLVVAVLAFGTLAAAATSPSSGARPVPVKQAGFRISLPAGWTVYDPTKQESREQFAAAAKEVPELAAYSGAAAQGADHAVLNAVSMTPEARTIFGVQQYADARVLE